MPRYRLDRARPRVAPGGMRRALALEGSRDGEGAEPGRPASLDHDLPDDRICRDPPESVFSPQGRLDHPGEVVGGRKAYEHRGEQKHGDAREKQVFVALPR